MERTDPPETLFPGDRHFRRGFIKNAAGVFTFMLENEEESYHFFQDHCTISELRSMEQRFEVAMLLNDGMIYNDILEKTGASSATISRVNRCLLNGAGGYESILDKIQAQREKQGDEQL